MSAVLTIDKNKVRQSFASAANSYDELASLQRNVGLKLMQYFSEISSADHVLDIGCGTGFLTQQLVKQTGIKQITALDIAYSMVQRTRSKLQHIENVHYLCADAEYIPVMNDSVDSIISNLALQWCQNLTAVFRGFNSALKAEGQLLFSTFGPQTLWELKKAWSEVDDYSHVNEFYSAPELEMFLQQAGFKNIRCESLNYQSEYQTVKELMRELKGIGAHNVLSRRNRKTTSKTSMQRMISAYEKHKLNGMIPATYEIIFVTGNV